MPGQPYALGVTRFVIQPHVRLQEWVAEELGFFRDEGLDYEFQADAFSAKSLATSAVSTTDEAPIVTSGALAIWALRRRKSGGR